MTTIIDANIEELVEQVVKAQGAIEEYEAIVKVCKDELRDRLIKMKISGTKTKSGYFVTRQRRLSFTDVPLSLSRELGCIKEAPDTTKLSKLYKEGVKIAGVKNTEFVSIRESKE